MKHTLLTLALSSCISISHAASYVPPNTEDKVLLKTDQLPLDTSTMRWISSYLTELARIHAGSDAKRLQASAKLLVIAEQLDHNNPKIKEAQVQLVSNKRTGAAGDMEAGRKRLRRILTYLNEDSGSSQGKLLASLILDALAPIVPTDSPLASYKAPQDIWKNTIPALSAFEKDPESTLVSNERIIHSDLKPMRPREEQKAAAGKIAFNDNKARSKSEDKAPKKHEGKASAEGWKRNEFTLKAPVYTYELVGEYNRPKYTRGITLLNIEVKPRSSSEGKLKIKSKPYHQHDHLSHQAWSVQHPLQALWDNLPAGEVQVETRQAYAHFNDNSLVVSPLILGLDASLRDSSLKSNLLTIASIDGRAQFKRSKDFWNTLGYLTETASDMRVLVGPDCEGDLLQLIALGKPDFFIKNEVIEISGLEQARHFYSKSDDSAVAEATALFAEVKEAIEHKSLRSMTENKYVREKLEKVLETMPNHLSAKILLEYGSRKKPSTLESKYFGYELSKHLHSISRKLTSESSNLGDDEALEQSKKIDEGIERLPKIISAEDRKIYDKVDKFSDELRAYARAKKNYEDKKNDYYKKSYIKKLRELKSLNNSLQIDIARLTGRSEKDED
ncbi:hypothetical protein [Rubritalea tangerina]|uniref:Uncharacterized protein n=1 Tax=Rubritalea tangerina TaxID=430798 RepID=A0ABW4ZF82_9BACT